MENMKCINCGEELEIEILDYNDYSYVEQELFHKYEQNWKCHCEKCDTIWRYSKNYNLINCENTPW